MLRRFEGSVGGYFALPERVAPSAFRSRRGKESLAVAAPPGTAAMPPVSGLSPCGALVERHDPDRYLASLSAPEAQRRDLDRKRGVEGKTVTVGVGYGGGGNN